MNRGAIPVLVERTLLIAADHPDPAVIEQLVSFQRGGHRLLLVAPRPIRWRPTRKAVDRDLAIQQELHQCFTRAGAEIDGVYYLAAGLFKRRGAMARELDGIAQRYERKIDQIALIGNNAALLDAYAAAGGPVLAVGKSTSENARSKNAQRVDTLADALSALAERSD